MGSVRLGTVIGSVGPVKPGPDIPLKMVGKFGYFIRWDDLPDVPVFVAGPKIDLAPHGNPQ